MYDSLFSAGSATTGFDPETKMVQEILQNADPYGCNPHLDPPSNYNTPFAPQYVALLYVRLDAGWGMTVNHASYALDSSDDEPGRLARLNKALGVMKDRLDLWYGNPPRDVAFGDQELLHHNPFVHQLPYHPDLNRLHDSASFEDFRFRSQTELFVFVHHPGVRVQLVEGDLIGFSAKPTATAMKMPNGAFFRAKIGDVSPLGAAGNDVKLIRMENHVTDGDGYPFPRQPQPLPNPLPAQRPGPSLEYAMDIKFQVNAGPAGWVTMVIDPDTGNGTGNEP